MTKLEAGRPAARRLYIAASDEPPAGLVLGFDAQALARMHVAEADCQPALDFSVAQRFGGAALMIAQAGHGERRLRARAAVRRPASSCR